VTTFTTATNPPETETADAVEALLPVNINEDQDQLFGQVFHKPLTPKETISRRQAHTQQ
jgi:hypothetical protein